MSIAFYFDEHINAAITTGLLAREVDVLTVDEDGYSGREDPEVLDRAGELVRAVFSFDKDYPIELSRRLRLGIECAPIIRALPHEITIRQCIDELELIAVCCDWDELKNSVLYLPLKYRT